MTARYSQIRLTRLLIFQSELVSNPLSMENLAPVVFIYLSIYILIIELSVLPSHEALTVIFFTLGRYKKNRIRQFLLYLAVHVIR